VTDGRTDGRTDGQNYTTPKTKLRRTEKSTDLDVKFYKSSAVATFIHNRHGPKKRGAVVPFHGGELSPVQHNVAWAEVYFHTEVDLGPGHIV